MKMHCCSNCFQDSEIRAIIIGNNQKGVCDFCGGTDVYIYDIRQCHTIAEMLDLVLDVYSPIEELPDNFPSEKTDLLKNFLYNNWRIFNLDPEAIYKLVKAICADRYFVQPDLFDNSVGIYQNQVPEYLNNYSILRAFRWDDFVDGIKRKNRFHSNYINTNMLSIFLKCAAKTHKAGEVYFRSRICPNEKGYSCSKMGAPPDKDAKGGRVNPMGISILYLSDSLDTTLYEVRAGIFDYVSVGRFVLKKDIEVINLTNIDRISPFIGIDYGFDFTQYAINIEHIKMIAQEIAKPLRNDNILDYLPTQYISDFIKSGGYEGIEYPSTMSERGINLAVFDASFFKCTRTNVYDIQTIKYSCDRIK